GSGTNLTRLTEGSITASTPSTPSGSSTGGTTTVGAPVSVITAMESSVAVNQAIHVEGISASKLNAGTALTALLVRDFGDPNGKYNKLEGFNAAHIYDTPGTYTIRLTITNEAGRVSTTSKTITITSDTRRRIYVSSAGSDSNNGSSSSSPVRTAARAA